MSSSNLLLQHHNVDIDYHATKKFAIDNQPLVTQMPLSSIEFGNNETIKLNGKLVKTSDSAYKQLLKNVLSVQPDFVDKFAKITDEKTKLSMLSTLKSGLVLKKGKDINIIADRNTQTITGFSMGQKYMTNEILFEFFEQVMNRYGNLGFKDISVESNGNLVITSRTSEVTAYRPGEEFKGGLTFSNDYQKGTVISHNALRMVCTNGLHSFQSIPFTFKSLEKLYEKLDKLNGRNFMMNDFEKTMEEKMNNVASLSELMLAKNFLLANSKLTEDNIDLFLPISSTTDYLSKHRVDVSELNISQQKNCPTEINMWDLINVVTDFGSHNHGYEANFNKIQGGAGYLFNKKCDSQNFLIFYN